MRKINLACFGVKQEGLVTDWVAEGELEGFLEEVMVELSSNREEEFMQIRN